VSELKCTIPLSTLQEQPLGLTLGDSVQVTVTASNAYGESEESVAGNGAIIVEVPDAPVGLIDDTIVTSD